MVRYKGMTICRLGSYLQRPICLEILDLGHCLAYCILTYGVTILMIKLDGLLKIPRNFEFILVIDIVPLSLGITDIEHPNKLLGILGQVPFPLPLGSVKELIISCIGYKGEFVIFFDGMHSLPCLLSSVLYNLDF